jgi:ParB/RepB/Spo0J family partition protein
MSTATPATGNGTTDHMPLPSARDMDVALSSLIVDDAFNSRTNLDGSTGDEHTKVSHVQDSMQSAGQITPILVETRRQGKTERFYLISGFRRVAAAKKLGWDTIKARAFEPMSEKQRIYLNLLENTARQDISAYDTAMACAKLIALGETSEQVGLRLGKSDSYIRNLNNSASKLCKLVLDRWRLESSASFGGKAKVCSTDWLAKVCNLPVDQQEVEYFSKLASKDPKAHAEAKGTDGTNGATGGTEEPKATIVKRPSKIALENARTAMKAKINSGSAHKEELLIAISAINYALGEQANILHGVVTLFDAESDKLVEAKK